MTRAWFPPVPILELGRAVERAVKTAPRQRKGKPTKASRAFQQKTRPTRAETMRFHEQVGALVGDRFAIKMINGRYEIWDTASHDVFGAYRTYEDAFLAAEQLA